MKPWNPPHIALAAAVLAFAGGWAAPEDAPVDSSNLRNPDRAAFESAAAKAREALDAGRSAEAAGLFEEALRARPDSAEAAYNLGVAQYRAGNFKEASDAFARAAALSSQGVGSNAALAADSLYNRAAGFYSSTRELAEAAQQALEAREQAGGRGADPSQLPPIETDPKAIEQALKDARSSLQGFKDAALANPDDRDARANAQQARRLVRALEAMKEMQKEQQKDQQGDQQQDQQQQKQGDQKQQGQQGEQGQDQQQKDQEQQDSQSQGEQQDQQQDQKDEQSKQGSQSQQDQQNPGKPKDNGQEEKDEKNQKKPEDSKDRLPKPGDEQQQDQPKEPQPGDKDESKDQKPGDEQAEGEPREMTKEDANRLLQAVRDGEKRRRAQQEAQQAQRQARRRAPEKDW